MIWSIGSSVVASKYTRRVIVFLKFCCIFFFFFFGDFKTWDILNVVLFSTHRCVFEIVCGTFSTRVESTNIVCYHDGVGDGRVGELIIIVLARAPPPGDLLLSPRRVDFVSRWSPNTRRDRLLNVEIIWFPMYAAASSNAARAFRPVCYDDETTRDKGAQKERGQTSSA